MFFRDSLSIINCRSRTLRSVEEDLRQALDKAKTDASQTSAALVQLQARETILSADIECKVTARSLLLLLISRPVSARFLQTGLITRFFINEHAATQRQPKAEAKKVSMASHPLGTCALCFAAARSRPSALQNSITQFLFSSGLVRRHARKRR